MSASVGDLGFLDIGDGRCIPVKVTRLRAGFVSRAERPFPGKGKAIFQGPRLALLTLPARSLPAGVDAVIAALPCSLAGIPEAQAAVEPHHVPACASCGASMPGENHERRLCDSCRRSPATTRSAYR